MLVAMCLCLLHGLGTARAQDHDGSVVVPRQCWSYATSDLDARPSVVDAANVYFTEKNDRVTAVSLVDGVRVWSTELDGPVVSNLVVNGSTLAAAVLSRQNKLAIKSLSLVSGIVVDSTPLGSAAGAILVPSERGLIAIAERRLFLNGRGSGSLREQATSAEAANGRIGVAGERTVYVGDIDLAIDASLAAAGAPSALEFTGDDILVGDERGALVRVDLSNGRPIWTLKTGGRITSIVPTTRSDAIVGSFDNFVYRVDLSTGHVIWKKRQQGRVAYVVAIDDGLVAAYSTGGSAIELIDAGRGKARGAITLAEGVELLQPPLASPGGVIAATTEGVALYSTGPCPSK